MTAFFFNSESEIIRAMRIFVWALRFLLLLALIGLAGKNDDPVAVHFFGTATWQAPLNLMILVVFIGGVAVGIFTLLPQIVAHKREVSRLRKLRGEPMPARNQRPQYPDHS